MEHLKLQLIALILASEDEELLHELLSLMTKPPEEKEEDGEIYREQAEYEATNPYDDEEFPY